MVTHSEYPSFCTLLLTHGIRCVCGHTCVCIACVCVCTCRVFDRENVWDFNFHLLMEMANGRTNKRTEKEEIVGERGRERDVGHVMEGHRDGRRAREGL